MPLLSRNGLSRAKVQELAESLITGGDAEIDAYVQGLAGADVLSVIEPVDGRLFTGSSAPAANTAYLSLFRLVEGRTITTVAIQHASPSGNGDVGVYRFDGTNYVRIGSSGSTALTGSNALQVLTLTAAVDLEPDTDYWLAFAADNGVTTLYRTLGLTGSFGRGNKALSKGTSFPLPATISSPSATGYVPYLGAM